MIHPVPTFRQPGAELVRTKSDADEGPLGKDDQPAAYAPKAELERKYTSSYSTSRLDPYRNNSLQTSSELMIPKFKTHRSNPSAPLIFTESSNNDKDKHRLVRQFYNVNQTQSSLVGSSSASQAPTSVTSTPSAKNRQTNFSFVSPDKLSRVSSHLDIPQSSSHAASDTEDEEETFSLRKEVSKLENSLMETIKTKIARVEMENHQLLDQLTAMYSELDSLNKEINTLYDDLSENLKSLRERDYSKFTTSKAASEKQTAGVLSELDAKLNDYKAILNQEKEYIGKLDSDIGVLEKARAQHVKLRKNRNMMVFFFAVGLLLSFLCLRLV